MLIKDSRWNKLDNKPTNVELRIVTSDYGTNGTFEDIFWDSQFGQVYRKRSWGESSVMKAGEVWYIFKPE